MTIAHPRPGPTAHSDPAVSTLAHHRFTRRSALLGAAAVTGGLAMSGSVLTGCASDGGVTEETRTAQLLAPLATAASEDSVAARALIARDADRAAALAVIAAERQTHATVLNDEIARLAPDLARPSTASGVVDAPTTSTPGATSSTDPAASAAPAAPAVTTVDELRARLQSAGRTAGDLAVAMSGYRAGMLGSIAAALSAEVEVQLA